MLELIVPALGVIGAFITAFLTYVAFLPRAFRIERTAEIQAPAEAVFPLINDLKAFNSWNPFAATDPEIKITYSGPPSGVGAAYAWTGTRSGAGRAAIATAMPASRVTMALDFAKPFEAHNLAEFTLVPHGAATRVTWAMTGERPFAHKLVGTFVDMDKMVGGEFAKGLAALKVLAETAKA